MNKSTKAAAILVVALIGSAYLTKVAKTEALIFGLSAAELSLLGGAAGVIVAKAC